MQYLNWLLINGKAVYLYSIEGFSYKEIGEILDKNVGQVKSLIHKGRKKLKEILQKEGENCV